MNENPLHWKRTLERLADLDGDPRGDILGIPEVPPVGVPVIGEPAPLHVRNALRALASEAFRRGNREGPLVDALADVEGWDVPEYHFVTAKRTQVIVPVRGAHDALRLSLGCLVASGMRDTETTVACAEDEARAVIGIAQEPRDGPSGDEPMSVHPTPLPQSFAANVNLGASRSRSEFLVLLNSDAFVGPGWLDALLAPFADPEVVAVGPMGTNVSGHQAASIEAMFPSDPSSADIVSARTMHWRDYAASMWGVKSREPYAARRLVGFCLAVRRSAWDRVGGMDERFENECDDDDLCIRLSLVGKLVVVPDLLVLHHGSASFAELPDAQANYKRTRDENRPRFFEKWGWFLRDWNAWCDERGWR